MLVSAFAIGTEFWCSGGLSRCTDVGSLVVVAIRIDEVTVSSSDGARRVLPGPEAEASGWFDGSPYAGAGTVFDESDLDACSLDLRH